MSPVYVRSLTEVQMFCWTGIIEHFTISYNSNIVNTTYSQIKFYWTFETYGELLFEYEPLEENLVMT